jgi:hypothetical protein
MKVGFVLDLPSDRNGPNHLDIVARIAVVKDWPSWIFKRPVKMGVFRVRYWAGMGSFWNNIGLSILQILFLKILNLAVRRTRKKELTQFIGKTGLKIIQHLQDDRTI